MRLRIALANDYQAPAAQLLSQMGAENVDRIAASFGIARGEQLSLLNAAGAYGVFAQDGVYFGQQVKDALEPVTILRVEGNDGSLWLDWTTPQAKPVLTPGLAYLMNHILSDETARWPSLGQPNVTEINRPAGVKLGQSEDGLDSWAIGYSPLRVDGEAHRDFPARRKQKAVAGRAGCIVECLDADRLPGPAQGWLGRPRGCFGHQCLRPLRDAAHARLPEPGQ
jgi:membrane carboxypeptidase/penicillin-binding protein